LRPPGKQTPPDSGDIAMQTGAECFLQKPFSEGLLLELPNKAEDE
jgi:FixJ family two-component response regulator